jgi:hypothetical protein
VEESGVKANLSRSIVSFDPEIDAANDSRVLEALDVFKRWHGKADGRIKVDMSLHAEYTNVEKCCRYMGELTKKLGVGMHVHISETASEHEACIERHGVSPTKFFLETGVLDSPVTAAHAVWVDDEDIAIMAKQGVSVAHNPVSNLKLGSGIMPYKKMKEAGVGKWVVIHSPKVSYGYDCENDEFVCVPSLDLPNGYIKGSTGAGDAYCSGILYGVYKDMSLLESMRLARSTAACSLSENNGTDGMRSFEDAMKLEKIYPEKII